MRVKRVEKFKNHRRRKAKKIIIFGVAFPCLSIILGYFITAAIILPSMGK